MGRTDDRRDSPVPVPRSVHTAQALRLARGGDPLGRDLAEERNLPLRSLPPPGGDLRRRYAAADGLGLAPSGTRLQLHPHRHRGPLQADAGSEHLLSDGLGRQRSSHRTAGAELLPRPLQPERTPRSGALDRGGDGKAAQEATARGLPGELHRALSSRHRRGRAGVHDALEAPGPVGGLEAGVPDHRRSLSSHRPALLSRSLREGTRLQQRGAHHVGRGLPLCHRPGRDRGPPLLRCLPRHPLRRGGKRPELRHLHHPAGAVARLRRRDRPPRGRALRGSVRQAGRDPAVPGSGADLSQRARRSREGNRHPDGLHLRRFHRRAVVARAGAGPATDRGTRWSADPGQIRRSRLRKPRCGGGEPVLPPAGRRKPGAGAAEDRRAPRRARGQRRPGTARRSRGSRGPSSTPSSTTRRGRGPWSWCPPASGSCAFSTRRRR